MHDKHTSSADSDEGSGTGVQIAFLVILLLIFFALVGSIVYMTLQVMRYRKETTETYTAFNAMNTGEEMITYDTSHLQQKNIQITNSHHPATTRGDRIALRRVARNLVLVKEWGGGSSTGVVLWVERAPA